jgi:hypothetical protein
VKTYGRVDVWIHIFLTSALAGGEWSASRPGRFTPGGNNPRYPLDRRLGGPQSRSGRRREMKVSPLSGPELRPLGHAARSQSLNRLRYPGTYRDRFFYNKLMQSRVSEWECDKGLSFTLCALPTIITQFRSSATKLLFLEMFERIAFPSSFQLYVSLSVQNSYMSFGFWYL